eukprot:UN12990
MISTLCNEFISNISYFFFHIRNLKIRHFHLQSCKTFVFPPGSSQCNITRFSYRPFDNFGHFQGGDLCFDIAHKEYIKVF